MNFKSIVMCLALISYHAFAQALSFTKTRDEEIAELVEFICKNNSKLTKEDLYAQVENYSQGDDIFPISKLIFEGKASDNEEKIKTANSAEDTLYAFYQLKSMMHIPDEIELHFNNSVCFEAGNDSTPAQYNAIDRRIELSADFFTLNPSEKLHTLIHELTHVKQHQREGLLDFNQSIKLSNFDHEYEAEAATMQAVSCPVCIQLIEDHVGYAGLPELKDLGYFTVDDIKLYKEQKNMKDVCLAHALDSEANQELRELLPFLHPQKKESWAKRLFYDKNKQHQDDIKERVVRLKLDCKISGSVQDRLSSVKFN